MRVCAGTPKGSNERVNAANGDANTNRIRGFVVADPDITAWVQEAMELGYRNIQHEWEWAREYSNTSGEQ